MNRRQEVSVYISGLIVAVTCFLEASSDEWFFGIVIPLVILGVFVFSILRPKGSPLAVPPIALVFIFLLFGLGLAQALVARASMNFDFLDARANIIESDIRGLDKKLDLLEDKMDDASLKLNSIESEMIFRH